MTVPRDADPALDLAGGVNAEDLFENAPCGYLSCSPDGTIARVNATFLRWTGYRAEDLIGRKRFQELLTAGGRIYHETHYAPLLRMQGYVREIAVDVVRADGRSLPALVNSAVQLDADGAPVSIRTVIIDATERREYERELLRERRRAEDSEAHARLLARTLQTSLIPPSPPAIAGLDIAAVYRPAGAGDEVGGDFYDVFETGRGDHAIVIGDVCGKGVEAATVTALSRYTIRATATRTSRPRVVLSELNRALLLQSSERFVTVLFASVRRSPEGSVRLTVASGGHPLPLHVRGDGTIATVGTAGTLLGVLDEIALKDASLELRPGEAIAFYTDGVTEARVNGDVLYGEERLAELLSVRRADDAATIVESVANDVVSYQQGSPRDDIAMIVVKVPSRSATSPDPD